MTKGSSEGITNKKSLIIGFAIGFIIAFAVTWYYFSSASNKTIEDQIPAGELMKQEAALSKPAAPVVADVVAAPVAVVESPGAKLPADSKVDDWAEQLISKLFTDSEKGRKQAKKALVKNFHKNPSVMKVLINKCSTEFDEKDRNDSGIFQGIDVLLMVSEKSPQTLRVHKAAMYSFFEKTKGQYRERTQARIEEIRSRVGG